MRIAIVPAAVAAIVGGAMTGCAAPPVDMGARTPERACFYPDALVNFRTSGDNIAYIRVGRGEVYELRAAGFCRGLSSARSLAVRETSGTGARVCVGDSVSVLASAPGLDDNTNVPCRARVARRLTEEDVAALPARERPN